MTRREWVKEHYPEKVNKKYGGGVYGCPDEYGIGTRDCRIIRNSSNEKITDNQMCTMCWDKEVSE